jgi:hypothetical protein
VTPLTELKSLPKIVTLVPPVVITTLGVTAEIKVVSTSRRSSVSNWKNRLRWY